MRRFCNRVFKVVPQFPHTVQQYLKRDSTRLVYGVLRAFSGRNRVSFILKIAADSFLHI